MLIFIQTQASHEEFLAVADLGMEPAPRPPYFQTKLRPEGREKNGGARSLRSFPRYADELENECMIRFHLMISLLTPIYITCSRVIAQPVLPRLQQNWNLEVLDFEGRGKSEYPEKNLSGRGREPTTNSTHMWRPRQDSNRGCIGGRRVLSPLRHPLLPRSY